MAVTDVTQLGNRISRELVFAHGPWEIAVRSLLLDPRRVATGAMRWNLDAERVEWLVDRLDVSEQLPRAVDRWPMTDWMVLTLEQEPARSPSEILAEIGPRASQTVVVVTLNQGDRGHWSGAVHHEGMVHSLDGVRIVGPRMLHLTPEQSSGAFIVPQEGRWSRTAGGLGAGLWKQVRDAHVLLVGCGRNGTMAAWNLCGLGVQHLTLVDADSLEAANLDAMPGLTVNDLGQPKVTSLARRLVEFNPDLLVRCFTQPVTDVLSRLRSRFDLIVSALDRDSGRLACSWLSREMLIPHLDIATSVTRTDGDQRQLAGDARLLLPFEGCVECVGGIADPTETLYEFAAPTGSLHRGEPVSWNQQRAGSLVHLNSLTVSAGMELWLSLLRGTSGSYWQRLAWEPEVGLRADGSSVTSAATCPHCRPQR